MEANANTRAEKLEEEQCGQERLEDMKMAQAEVDERPMQNK